uniref:Sulfotransferase domain-containing protein n=1 Tax=Alexandrium monilatum TaxID=311494 RepID=A0A7S4Q4P6_9DINO
MVHQPWPDWEVAAGAVCAAAAGTAVASGAAPLPDRAPLSGTSASARPVVQVQRWKRGRNKIPAPPPVWPAPADQAQEPLPAEPPCRLGASSGSSCEPAWRRTENDGQVLSEAWPRSQVQAQPDARPRQLVLVLGMPKCGTTSLHEAFRSAGLDSVHWALGTGEDLRADRELRLWGVDADRRLIGRLMERAAAQGLPPLSGLPHHVDAVAEMNGLVWGPRGTVQAHFPQISLLEELAAHYPYAHFILNVRDHRRWVRSVDSHNDLRKRLVYADLPGLPPGAGARDDELIGWVAAHHERVRARLGGGRARLLVFDIEHHGAEELVAFLGRRVAWGQHNATW